MSRSRSSLLHCALGIAWVALAGGQIEGPTVEVKTERLIVQSRSIEEAREVVEEAGGRVTHELSIIRAVGAEVTPEQRRRLDRELRHGRIWEDRLLGADALGCAVNGGG